MQRAHALTERLGLRSGTLEPLGLGTEHQTFLAGPYVIRLISEPSDRARSDLIHEATLLDLLQTRLPIAVPHPSLVAPDLGGFAYRQLAGQPLLGTRPAEAARLIDDLGALFAAMLNLDAALLRPLVDHDPYPLDDWRDEVVEDALRHGSALTERERRCIRAFGQAGVPEPPQTAAFCHNDLGAEHLLVDSVSGHLLGVLDWSDAAFTDPSRDLGRVRSDLGSAAVERIIRVAGISSQLVDPERIEFHARVSTLEDLCHGIETGDRRYTDAARRAFLDLFPA